MLLIQHDSHPCVSIYSSLSTLLYIRFPSLAFQNLILNRRFRFHTSQITFPKVFHFKFFTSSTFFNLRFSLQDSQYMFLISFRTKILNALLIPRFLSTRFTIYAFQSALLNLCFSLHTPHVRRPFSNRFFHYSF